MSGKNISGDKALKRARRRRLSRIGMISVLPYLTFAPLFSNLFGGNLINLSLSIGALIGFSYALFELRQGLRLEAEEDHAESLEARQGQEQQGRAQTDHPPRPVRSGLAKVRGLLALGAGIAAFAYMGESNLLTVVGIAALTVGAATFAIGPPRFSLSLTTQQFERKPEALPKRPLELALQQAEGKIQQIATTASQMRDGQLRAQVFGVHDAAWAVVEELQRDKADLPKARRFLVTYLDGAVKIVCAYAGQSDAYVSAQMREKFSDTLVTLETTFIAQLKKLRDDDAMDLDIQMDVLDAQMKGEGVL